MRILGIGNALLDVVHRVSDYPAEDSEIRALGRRRVLGGNTANSLVSLSLLGHDCHWAGTLSDDAESLWIRQALQDYQIDTSQAEIVGGRQAPMSCVTLNSRNGSRTIVHFRDLPEYSAALFEKINPADFDWIHFEGRNVEVLQEVLARLNALGLKNFSLEVEKPREGIEALFAYPALLLFSRHYVREHHEGSIRDFFSRIRAGGVRVPVFCGWGSGGGWAMNRQGDVFQQPAWRPEQVVDTLGAGDAFNAGIIHAYLAGHPVEKMLETACHVAGFKCGHEGFDALAGLSLDDSS